MTPADPTTGDIRDNLRSTPPDEYGDSYREHCLEVYKLYVEMADQISARRQSANAFFLTINTALATLAGYLSGDNDNGSGALLHCVLGTAGIIICYMWYRLVRSYSGLNGAKFKVIEEIEGLLPIKPYAAEWESVGRGKDPKRYLPFTHIEMGGPWVFLCFHVFIVACAFWPNLLTIAGP